MDISQLNFLLADDDDAILEILGAALTTFGVENVLKCASGVAVITALSDPDQHFHCIISDYSMPPISGLDILQGVRMGRYPSVPREIPFIIVTVSGKADVVQAALALDVSAYVMKPVKQQALSKAIDRATSRLFVAKSPDDYAAVKFATD
jgi:CheY-like chemotaxis protein